MTVITIAKLTNTSPNISCTVFYSLRSIRLLSTLFLPLPSHHLLHVSTVSHALHYNFHALKKFIAFAQVKAISQKLYRVV